RRCRAREQRRRRDGEHRDPADASRVHRGTRRTRQAAAVQSRRRRAAATLIFHRTKVEEETSMNMNASAERPELAAIRRRMFIGGQWVEARSGKTLPVYDPSTGEEIARVPDAQAEDVDAAVRSARATFES